MIGVGLLLLSFASGQVTPSIPERAEYLKSTGLHQLGAFELLRELSDGIGPRLAGSENAAKAVEWGVRTMDSLQFQNVRQVPCKVPHWVRGNMEKASAAMTDGTTFPLTCCALGQSPGTGPNGISGEVIEVHSLVEASKLRDKAKGKILFFNHPFDVSDVNTFAAYGEASDQRFAGPSIASAVGAKAALVRSMTSDNDDVPHTGVTEFPDSVKKIPAAALSLVAADALSDALKKDPSLVASLSLSCESLPDVDSASVIGEIPGQTAPNEVVVMGGHLDSWDLGRGAHDDGAGVVQALEALKLLKNAGWRPKRTIRVCLWMDEEQKGSGAAAYLQFVKTAKEVAYAGIESDSGGFAPRAFGSSESVLELKALDPYLPKFRDLEVDRFNPHGETGADVGPLGEIGARLFGLVVESQRYFDYHHSAKDTLDKVNPRELELGAIDMALLAWALANQ